MPLDPEVVAILKQMEEAGGPPLDQITPDMARSAFAELVALQGAPEDVARVDDREVAGAAGGIPIRIYQPTAAKTPGAVFYYIHGGGWVIMDLDSHDPICRAFANSLGCPVVAVNYRRAPEARFPAAVEDSYAVLRWIADGELGSESTRIAVGGDSAGGNLAAAMTLLSRQRGGPVLAAQVLHCPVTHHSFDTESYRKNAEGFFLTRELMEWFWGHYLGSESDGANPLASPLREEDLTGLPPALVQTAEYDPLRDEGAAYAGRLAQAGVETTYTMIPSVVHDPWLMMGAVPRGRASVDEAVSFLRKHLS
jgi:acetyl esterase